MPRIGLLLDFATALGRDAYERPVIASAQATVGREHKDIDSLDRIVGYEQRMRNTRTAIGQILYDLGNTLGVIGRSRRAVHRLFKAGRRDELHRPGDLANIPNALSTFIELTNVCHCQ